MTSEQHTEMAPRESLALRFAKSNCDKGFRGAGYGSLCLYTPLIATDWHLNWHLIGASACVDLLRLRLSFGTVLIPECIGDVIGILVHVVLQPGLFTSALCVRHCGEEGCAESGLS